MNSLIPILAALIVFAVIVYVGVMLVRGRDARIKRRSLAMVAGYASSDPHSVLARVEQQDSLIRSSAIWLGDRLTPAGARRRIERQTLYAGRNDPAAVEDVIIRKVVYLFAGLLFGLLIGMLLGGTWWLAIPVFAVVGFFVPDSSFTTRGSSASRR